MLFKARCQKHLDFKMILFQQTVFFKGMENNNQSLKIYRNMKNERFTLLPIDYTRNILVYPTLHKEKNGKLSKTAIEIENLAII